MRPETMKSGASRSRRVARNVLVTLATQLTSWGLTFAVMLGMALVIANLVANVRAQTRVAGARERRTSLLYARL